MFPANGEQMTGGGIVTIEINIDLHDCFWRYGVGAEAGVLNRGKPRHVKGRFDTETGINEEDALATLQVKCIFHL